MMKFIVLEWNNRIFSNLETKGCYCRNKITILIRIFLSVNDDHLRLVTIVTLEGKSMLLISDSISSFSSEMADVEISGPRV